MAFAFFRLISPHLFFEYLDQPICDSTNPSSAADIVLSSVQIVQLDALFDPNNIAGARYPKAGWVGIED
ncbi:hypothetical protein [Psychrobacter pygoscelis]|uniref:hypothetical protein n=1 Tax=Psychrobacter pygoscelis TaxID=2488563 RepID=UPI001040C9C6|nr:hypothetical protein [Psychrobacter pygoscelis]